MNERSIASPTTKDTLRPPNSSTTVSNPLEEMSIREAQPSRISNGSQTIGDRLSKVILLYSHRAAEAQEREYRAGAIGVAVPRIFTCSVQTHKS